MSDNLHTGSVDNKAFMGSPMMAQPVAPNRGSSENLLHSLRSKGHNLRNDAVQFFNVLENYLWELSTAVTKDSAVEHSPEMMKLKASVKQRDQEIAAIGKRLNMSEHMFIEEKMKLMSRVTSLENELALSRHENKTLRVELSAAVSKLSECQKTIAKVNEERKQVVPTRFETTTTIARPSSAENMGNKGGTPKTSRSKRKSSPVTQPSKSLRKTQTTADQSIQGQNKLTERTAFEVRPKLNEAQDQSSNGVVSEANVVRPQLQSLVTNASNVPMPTSVKVLSKPNPSFSEQVIEDDCVWLQTTLSQPKVNKLSPPRTSDGGSVAVSHGDGVASVQTQGTKSPVMSDVSSKMAASEPQLMSVNQDANRNITSDLNHSRSETGQNIKQVFDVLKEEALTLPLSDFTHDAHSRSTDVPVKPSPGKVEIRPCRVMLERLPTQSSVDGNLQPSRSKSQSLESLDLPISQKIEFDLPLTSESNGLTSVGPVGHSPIISQMELSQISPASTKYSRNEKERPRLGVCTAAPLARSAPSSSPSCKSSYPTLADILSRQPERALCQTVPSLPPSISSTTSRIECLQPKLQSAATSLNPATEASFLPAPTQVHLPPASSLGFSKGYSCKSLQSASLPRPPTTPTPPPFPTKSGFVPASSPSCVPATLPIDA